MTSVLRKVADEQRGPSPRLWYRVSEVAGMLDVSEATLYRAINAGHFPAVRLTGVGRRDGRGGGRLVVPAQAVERLAEMALESWSIVDSADLADGTWDASIGGVA